MKNESCRMIIFRRNPPICTFSICYRESAIQEFYLCPDFPPLFPFARYPFPLPFSRYFVVSSAARTNALSNTPMAKSISRRMTVRGGAGRKKTPSFRYHNDAHIHPIPTTRGCDILPLELYSSTDRLLQSQNTPQQGSLSGTVCSNDCGYLSFPNL